MTARERILSVYRNEKPDRIPVALYGPLMQYGETQRLARNRGLGIIDLVPGVTLLGPGFFPDPGFVSEVRGAELDVAYRWIDGELIEIDTYETPLGSVSQHVRRDPAYGTRWRQKHYIESREDYPVVRYLVENTVFRSRKKALQQKINELGQDGVVLSRLDRSPYQKLLTELADPQGFLVDLHTDPQPALELMQVIAARLEEQLEMALDGPAQAIWLPDNVTADLTPPQAFESYCVPHIERFGRLCREAGKISVVHLDGRLGALRTLIDRTTFDVIDSFSFAEMSGDIPLSELSSIWPGKVICPNFPSSLALKSKEQALAYLLQAREAFGSSRPWLLELSENIPTESYPWVLPLLAQFSEAAQ